jgi:hypothetical protein
MKFGYVGGKYVYFMTANNVQRHPLLMDKIHPRGTGMPGRGKGWPALREEAF